MTQQTTNTPLSQTSTEQLQQWVARYPWWGAARMELHRRGEAVPGSMILAARQRGHITPTTPATLKPIAKEELQRSQTLGIIDDFLRKGEHRITIDDATTDAPMGSFIDEEEFEEEFLSEELAEIYAKQHLFDLAIEIYQKLSLQDSQKSIYFAELIERLKAEQLKKDNEK